MYLYKYEQAISISNLPLISAKVFSLSSPRFWIDFLAIRMAIINIIVLTIKTHAIGAANAQMRPFSKSSQQLKIKFNKL